MNVLSDVNPIAAFLWLMMTAGIAMFCLNPIILMLALWGALLYYFARNPDVGLKRQLPYLLLFVASALFNPLFSHNGATVLFVLNHNPITLEALLYGMGSALSIGVFMFILSFFFGDLLSVLFTKDAAVVDASAQYLKGFSFDCLLVCLLFCFMGYFNGCGKTLFVMTQGLIGALAVRMPFSYLMSLRPEPTLFSIGLATPVATVTSIILCILYFRKTTAKQADILK